MTNNFVLGFIFDDHNNVLLIQKNRPAWQKGKLNGIGGKIEPDDEGVRTAMRRECLEETGLDIEKWTLFAVIDETNDNHVIHVFSAHVDEFVNLKETDEPLRVVPANSIYNLNVISNLQWLIPLAMAKGILQCVRFRICQMEKLNVT